MLVTRIPLVVAAKNEERSLAATLRALEVAREHARATTRFDIAIYVVLDDTTDGSEHIAKTFDGVTVARSSGGKVEAQRAGVFRAGRLPDGEAPFTIFCDADVLPSEDALAALCTVLDEQPEVEVATCALRPLPPRRATPLATALHTYNRRRGFSSSRTWFNGKLFAIRRWSVPTRAEVADRARALAPDAFYDFDAGLAIDDIYLSRTLVMQHGPRVIAEASRGEVAFRAPETWRGMNRYYRRMRRELERLDLLFPETVPTARRWGSRRADLLPQASLVERMHHAIFWTALLACRGAYVAERAWVRHVRRAPRPWWKPVEETKG